MKFSVLLSIYAKESPKNLIECFDSIFSQSLIPDEVVLVEDGPLTDALYKVIDSYKSRYSQLKVISFPENRGLGAALNDGLKHCSYDLVARMDTDDISKKNRFEKQVSYMSKHPEIDILSSSIDEFVDNISNVLSSRNLPQEHHEIFEYGKKRCPINHPVVIFRKQAVEEVGGYQSFYLFEDYYLWARMLVGGKKFHNLPDSLLYFRATSDMFKRRGGLKYAWSEVLFQIRLYKIGYLNCMQMIKNIGIRFTVRILPNSIRQWFYNKFLRK